LLNQCHVESVLKVKGGQTQYKYGVPDNPLEEWDYTHTHTHTHTHIYIYREREIFHSFIF